MKCYFIYILLCNDNSYYIGVTNSLEKRLFEHETGVDDNCYTFTRRPVKLVHSEETTDVWSALNREKQLKGWSRKKKEALISGNIDGLKKLASRI